MYDACRNSSGPRKKSGAHVNLNKMLNGTRLARESGAERYAIERERAPERHECDERLTGVVLGTRLGLLYTLAFFKAEIE